MEWFGWWQHKRLHLSKYRAEIIISAVSTVGGVVLSILADTFLSATTVDRWILGLLSGVAFLVVGLAFVIKRNVTSRVVELQQRVNELSGRGLPTQYDERKQHFSEEKSRLVEYLLRTTLPGVVKKVLDGRPLKSFKIAMVVDSGTTLEPFFPRIKTLGLGQIAIDDVLSTLELYTNSLSGSDAFCRESGIAVNQSQLHLFGGTQMEKYRAVTGEMTLKNMDTIKEEYIKSEGVIIGLITANWLLVGHAYNELILCSSEQGHLDYKRRLAEIADELIVVAPLGKLLKLDSTDELNNMLELTQAEPKYAGFSGFEVNAYTARNRENTHLLTTYRTRHESVLYNHSENLRIACNERRQKYTLCKQTSHLSLDHKVPRDREIEIEVPHTYLREHKQRVLQIA